MVKQKNQKKNKLMSNQLIQYKENLVTKLRQIHKILVVLIYLKTKYQICRVN